MAMLRIRHVITIVPTVNANAANAGFIVASYTPTSFAQTGRISLHRNAHRVIMTHAAPKVRITYPAN